MHTLIYKESMFGRKKIQAKRKSISAVGIENSTICTPETCEAAVQCHATGGKEMSKNKVVGSCCYMTAGVKGRSAKQNEEKQKHIL